VAQLWREYVEVIGAVFGFAGGTMQ